MNLPLLGDGGGRYADGTPYACTRSFREDIEPEKGIDHAARQISRRVAIATPVVPKAPTLHAGRGPSDDEVQRRNRSGEGS
jgi:hypothetical protein